MKIEMKPQKIKVEIPGYGSFDVTPLGAGAEAEIRILYRELNEALEESKQFQGLVDREKNGEKLDHESEEYKNALEAFNKAGALADKVKDLTYIKMRSVFTGASVDKLFNDFTYQQIQDIYRKAVDGGSV